VIGDETVKSHTRAIYRKLQVSDRAGAVAAALREGLFR
jgi:DNA-binding NarL/FixJ family response regulator